MFDESKYILEKLKYKYENKLYTLYRNSYNRNNKYELPSPMIIFDIISNFKPSKRYNNYKKKTIIYITREVDNRYAFSLLIYENRLLFKNLNLDDVIDHPENITLLERYDGIDIKIISSPSLEDKEYDKFYMDIFDQVSSENREIILMVNDKVIEWGESMSLQNKTKYDFPCLIFEDDVKHKKNEDENLRWILPGALWFYSISGENPRGNPDF